jgi:hypothetical protein
MPTLSRAPFYESSTRVENGRIVTAEMKLLITGLSGIYNLDALALAYLESLSPGSGYRYGDEHPDYPGRQLYLRHVTYRALPSDDAAEASLTYLYSPRGTASYSGVTSVEQVTTQVDRTGEPITVQPVDDGGDPVGDPVGAEASVEQASQILVAEVTLNTPTPGSVQATYQNKINSTTWQGKPAGAWRCRLVTFEEEQIDSGATWYRYRFEFSLSEPSGHQPKVLYHELADGDLRPQTPVVVGTNLVEVDWYDGANFNDIFPTI